MTISIPARTGAVARFLPEGLGTVLFKSLQKIKEHDLAMCRRIATDPNSAQFFAEYSLFEHSVGVAELCVVAALALGFNSVDAALLCTSACLHDQGKLFASMFWLNRQFTEAERLMAGHHARSSAVMFRNSVREHVMKSGYRTEFWYQPIFDMIDKHHAPWELKNIHVRRLGEILHFADIFVACMESRHRPGMSREEAGMCMRQQRAELLKYTLFAAQVIEVISEIGSAPGPDFGSNAPNGTMPADGIQLRAIGAAAAKS